MLPQGFFNGDWNALGAGALSLGLSAMAAFVYFLVQQGAFGVKTLLPGDHAVRTLFGRPIRYHSKPKSLFFFATLFDVYIVNTRTLVHDPIPVDLVVNGEKRRVRIWLESRVLETEEAVTNAIFALGDASGSHLKGNKRTQRVEALALEALARQTRDLVSWRDFDPTRVLGPVSQITSQQNGTRATAIRATDTAPTEAQVIADKLPSLKVV